MSYTNYSEMPYLLEIKSAFKGNSVEAKWIDNEYVIFSYNTIILRLRADGEVLSWDGGYYSQTTSRLQNILRDIYPELKQTNYINK